MKFSFIVKNRRENKIHGLSHIGIREKACEVQGMIFEDRIMFLA